MHRPSYDVIYGFCAKSALMPVNAAQRAQSYIQSPRTQLICLP